MKRVRMTYLVVVWMASLGISSCIQDDGETCQVSRDCSKGLICCRGAGAARGTCHAAADPACGEITMPIDAGENDSGANMSMPGDAG
ncbi:MAG TPA: hypothetical protein VGI70_03005 [Polyangiales bacterium]